MVVCKALQQQLTMVPVASNLVIRFVCIKLNVVALQCSTHAKTTKACSNHTKLHAHTESRCFSTAPSLEQTLHVAKLLLIVQRTLGTPGGSGGCSFKYAVYVTGSLNVEHRHHRNNTNSAAAIPAQPSQDRPSNHVVTAVNILAQRVVVDLCGCAGWFG